MKSGDVPSTRKRSRETGLSADAAIPCDEQPTGEQAEGRSTTAHGAQHAVVYVLSDEKASSIDDLSPPSTGNDTVITKGNSPGGTASGERKLKQVTLPSYGMVSDLSVFRKEIADRDAQIDELREKLAAAEVRLTERESTLLSVESQLEEAITCVERYQCVLREEMTRAARQSRSDARRALHMMHFEIGQAAVLQSNGREVWVEGNRMRELVEQLRELNKRRDEVEECKKAMEKRVRQLTRCCEDDSTSAEAQLALLDAQESLQLYVTEFTALGNSIQSLRQKQSDLSQEKKFFCKEIRRVNEEEASNFSAVEAIGQHDRYVLMHLLGKGGFSEVWKAFDLKEARYVACKIHHVQREWSPQVQQHYRSRVVRELSIMRKVEHPHLTRLYDVFEHGPTTFVAVMEYSGGMDLDTRLKRYGTLREADARLIVLQIVSALRYFAAQEQPIIHYDLKPANILFHCNNSTSVEIKITDFGLSKILPKRGGPNDDPTIELTSQGAGTYWYLPPECFETTATPRISNKVDVWSCGVIFYQMLFGRRPFAEGESQGQIWQNKLIISSARTLRFPDTPRVSQEAKDLIQKCLEYSPADRYDVVQLSQDAYLQRNTRRYTRTTERIVPPAAPRLETLPQPEV